MREFTDGEGRAWVAAVQRLEGYDYKGRYYFVFRPADGEGDEVALTDIRWNTERTARRTLETMSLFELRRRLASALGRSRARLAG